MIRDFELLDIPSTVKFMEKIVSTEPAFEGISFNPEWISDGLLNLYSSKLAKILVVEDKGIKGLLVGSLNYFLLTGEPSAECAFCWANGQTKPLREAFEKWAEEQGITRVVYQAFKRQTAAYKKQGYKQFSTIFVRSGQ